MNTAGAAVLYQLAPTARVFFVAREPIWRRGNTIVLRKVFTMISPFAQGFVSTEAPPMFDSGMHSHVRDGLGARSPNELRQQSETALYAFLEGNVHLLRCFQDPSLFPTSSKQEAREMLEVSRSNFIASVVLGSTLVDSLASPSVELDGASVVFVDSADWVHNGKATQKRVRAALNPSGWGLAKLVACQGDYNDCFRLVWSVCPPALQYLDNELVLSIDDVCRCLFIQWHGAANFASHLTLHEMESLRVVIATDDSLNSWSFRDFSFVPSHHSDPGSLNDDASSRSHSNKRGSEEANSNKRRTSTKRFRSEGSHFSGSESEFEESTSPAFDLDRAATSTGSIRDHGGFISDGKFALVQRTDEEHEALRRQSALRVLIGADVFAAVFHNRRGVWEADAGAAHVRVVISMCLELVSSTNLTTMSDKQTKQVLLFQLGEQSLPIGLFLNTQIHTAFELNAALENVALFYSQLYGEAFSAIRNLSWTRFAGRLTLDSMFRLTYLRFNRILLHDAVDTFAAQSYVRSLFDVSLDDRDVQAALNLDLPILIRQQVFDSESRDRFPSGAPGGSANSNPSRRRSHAAGGRQWTSRRPCFAVVLGKRCELRDCRFSHDVVAFKALPQAERESLVRAALRKSSPQAGTSRMPA